jgi:hypothetical protein
MWPFVGGRATLRVSTNRTRSGAPEIGLVLETVLAEHRHRGMARGAVVTIGSDGLGVAILLEQQMASLGRLTHETV